MTFKGAKAHQFPESISPLLCIIHSPLYEHFFSGATFYLKIVLLVPMIDSEVCGGGESPGGQCVPSLWVKAAFIVIKEELPGFISEPFLIQ